MIPNMRSLVALLALLIIVPVGYSLHSDVINGEEVSMLIELPTGAVFWGTGSSPQSATLKILSENNLNYTFVADSLMVNGFLLSKYHFDGSWNPGFSGNVLAWSDGVPEATPEHRYPLTSQRQSTGGYVPGNDTLWHLNVSGVRVVMGTSEILLGTAQGLQAYNLTGSLLWSVHSSQILSMCIYNRTVYFLDSSGALVAVSYSGAVRWNSSLAQSIDIGFLAAAEGSVYAIVHGNGSSNSTLFAYSNGVMKWNISMAGAPLSLTAFHGHIVAEIFNNNTFSIADVDKNGTVAWTYTFTVPVSLPEPGNMLYVHSSDGLLYSFSANGSFSTVRVGNGTGAPVIYRGAVYVPTVRGVVRVEGGTGRLVVNVTGAENIWLMPEHMLVENSSELGIYSLSGARIWIRHVSELEGAGVVNRVLVFYNKTSVFASADLAPPQITVSGKREYRYGETISLHIVMSDNVGVENGTVRYDGVVRYGSDLNITLFANFTGAMVLHLHAVDYSANTATKNITIMVFPRTFVISLENNRFSAHTTENLTVIIKDESMQPVSQAHVSVYIDGKFVGSGNTSDGYFTVRVYLTPGAHNLTVKVYKHGFVNKTESFKIYAEKNTAPVHHNYVILYLVIFALVSIIILAFVLRRKWVKSREIEHEKFKNQNE
ncbi:MAG: PQQ-binding-like beta-propeller repeat protein [Euryarchaeota archaeon]|nr:PQQ-binding-like beta-propeller repeat protein [Euryarchaeota archaeon]